MIALKKFFVTVLLAILIGIIFGKIMFNQYDGKLKEVFNEEEKVYFLQQGVYSSLESVSKNTATVNHYVVEKDDSYYRVYAGITKNEKNIDKIREVLIAAGNDIYVRELNLNQASFLDILTQYDLLLEKTDEKTQILQIQKQVLNQYKELVIDD